MEHDWEKSGYIDPYISDCKCSMCVGYEEALALSAKEIADAIDKDVIESIIKAGRVLDEQKVPTTGRFLRYIDENGEMVELRN